MTASKKTSTIPRLLFDDAPEPKVRVVPIRSPREAEPVVLNVPPEAFELDLPAHGDCGCCMVLEDEAQ